jgi:flagellar assembly factor FliW
LKITTSRFGDITIEKDKIIHMPYGIPGFPNQKQFVIFEHKKDSPFLWYQSIDEPALAFVITDPYLFKPDYTVDMDKLRKDLSWDTDVDGDQLKLYVIVKIPAGSPDKMSANLMGPILMNTVTREAVQVVLSDSSYSHSFPLIREDQPG